MDILDKIQKLDIITTVSCSRLSDNRWEVVHRIKHRRQYIDSGEWDEREASMSAIDSDLERATGLAMISLAAYLDAIGGDLFKPETAFIEEDSDIPETGLLQ